MYQSNAYVCRFYQAVTNSFLLLEFDYMLKAIDTGPYLGGGLWVSFSLPQKYFERRKIMIFLKSI
jgi:hypothetical protein